MGQIQSCMWGDEGLISERTEVKVEFNPNDSEQAVLAILDHRQLDGFKGRVCWVAASGFFTTSYCIFASNIIVPALNYVYPLPGDCASIAKQPFVVNLTTLVGTAIGMVLFGWLADKYGRKHVYGLELGIVIIATIGLTQASSGYGSMDVYGWIGFWRFVMGLGLGAEYTLSAVIAAEWSSTKTRGRMMASVFLMQAVGQVAAYAVTLAVLAGLGPRLGLNPDTTDPEVAKRAVDAIWRVVIGVGAFPAFLAFLLRRLLPETPRWLATHRSVNIATAETAGVFHAAATPMLGSWSGGQQEEGAGEAHADSAKPQTLWRSIKTYFVELTEYLSQKSRWRCFFGVVIAWYLLDLSVYGLGLDNLQVISQMYLSSAAPSIPCDQTWITDPSQPNITIYNMLQEDAIRNLQTISTGALPGSIIILLAIDYVPRAAWLGWTFVSLGGLFAVTGGTYFVSYMNDKHAMTIVFYVLAQLLLNLGPNTMTWILPAELFRTQYRGILYGLSAAAGKLGAITVQIIINQAVRNRGRDAFAGLLLGLCPAMLLGALFTWAWIPEVQLPRGQLDDVSDGSDGAETDSLRTVDSDGRSEEHEGAADDAHAEGKSFLEKLVLPNRTLEDIAEDPARDQTIGFGVKFSLLFGKIKRRKQKAAPAVPEMREQRA